jgi:non-specific serine/threonine protein kinase
MRLLAITPTGALVLEPHDEPNGDVPPEIAARIHAAFERGADDGLFHLGAVEVGTALPPSHAYLRDLAHDYVASLCAEPDLESLRAHVSLTPKRDTLEALARAVPPMTGAENVTPEVLAALWLRTHACFVRDIAKFRGTVAEFLHAKNPVWNTVGCVFFHLAENKGDRERPFAFLATYTTGVSTGSKPQHRALGKAVEESANAADRKSLLALLGPVHRASEKSALIKQMVEGGDLYHPLAWSPGEAHAFLKEVPALEESGVIVRVPNWWNARRPPRPEVRVTVGAKTPSLLGASALLDFAVDLTLDGEPMTRAEMESILRETNGLVLVKGRWVEIDREKLGAVLDHWKSAERAVSKEGLTFLEAMRWLAGTRAASSIEGVAEDVRAAWSRVTAGPWLEKVLDGLRSPEGLAAIDPGAALRTDLRAYQKVGLTWLFWLRSLGLGGVLADDMGLGKTIQVLALLLAVKKQHAGAAKKKSATNGRSPSILVVPASLLGNWTAEATRFAPSLDFLVVHPSVMSARELAEILTARVDAADVVLTTYGTLDRVAWMKERAWDLAILDEAQAIKSPSAKQTRAVKSLRARTRFALTGTPVENRLGDLWSIFDFVLPGLLGTAKEFSAMTKALAKREHQAYAPLRDLVRPYVLRRMKTDARIAPDLPQKTELNAYCALTKTQAALYEEAVQALARKLDDTEGIARRGAVLAALMRFKQICNHPSQWLGDGVYDPKLSGKLARLRELCEPIAARQEKVLVFTQFREMTDPLARFLETIFGKKGLVLHGSIAVRDRKALVDAFQSETGAPFFVLSLKAGGTGLNLTAASHVIHFDRWWNPAVENQATDRAYRIGQTRAVLVHKFVCRGTIEERIDQMIAQKRALSDEVLGSGGAEATLTEMSNEALLRMVSLDMKAALLEAS